MEPNQVIETKENSVGPVIAIIIVLVMVVLGGVYFWGERSNPVVEQSTAIVDDSNIEAVAGKIEQQSTSDESAAIDADLSGTDVNSVGADLENL